MSKETHLPFSPLTKDVLERLRDAAGPDRVVTDPERMADYAEDASRLRRMPEAVVRASDASQVRRLFDLANRFRFPVTPRGLGTGLAGGAVPVLGGVVLDCSAMNRILDVDPVNLIAVVEPGVINGELKKAAAGEGLFYPPDPASFDTCSIGGNAATNAGGPACVKYGTTRDYVLGLEVVIPTGTLLHTGVQTRKGVVGYDLTRLLVGSEGTLGVITRLVLKLVPRPPAVTTLVALFRDMVRAMEAVHGVLTSGMVPSTAEFLDRRCLGLVGDLLPCEGANHAGAFLLLESDGHPEVIRREIERMGEVCLEKGASDVLLAPDAAKRERMWDVRRQVSLRIEESAPVYIPEDVVVPLGQIAPFVSKVPELEAETGLEIYCFGHAGDGNIHLNITASGEAAPEKVEAGVRRILAEVLRRGGTISGEHGIGTAKKRYLSMELAPDSIRLQRDIKRLLDPSGILNPGKIFDE
ncbi:D-lactate dehydrogenase (cytochrome) [Desulfacinum infernum DSM 9756]|uniref:D-lactate dehydrogenase (Cytochrome) n=1 Tax=Desulfacinum infernum DSM 9756 TaxID=1121391 RepID=A0A1M4VKM0_9BACT|nr:FAD-linked oxidase C-terminal domain-containing protein [Desulfacinum infernum]SHE69539.1 D-lactate dehydrogenase (cytochrome) [Desulfacinum infernum DSM 9756]